MSIEDTMRAMGMLARPASEGNKRSNASINPRRNVAGTSTQQEQDDQMETWKGAVNTANKAIDDFNYSFGSSLDQAFDRLPFVSQELKDKTTAEGFATPLDIGEYFIPGLGMAKGAVEAMPQLTEGVTGKDWETGDQMDFGQQMASLGLGTVGLGASVVPGGGFAKSAKAASKVAKTADTATNAAKAADDVADVATDAAKVEATPAAKAANKADDAAEDVAEDTMSAVAREGQAAQRSVPQATPIGRPLGQINTQQSAFQRAVQANRPTQERRNLARLMAPTESTGSKIATSYRHPLAKSDEVLQAAAAQAPQSMFQRAVQAMNQRIGNRAARATDRIADEAVRSTVANTARAGAGTTNAAKAADDAADAMASIANTTKTTDTASDAASAARATNVAPNTQNVVEATAGPANATERTMFQRAIDAATGRKTDGTGDGFKNTAKAAAIRAAANTGTNLGTAALSEYAAGGDPAFMLQDIAGRFGEDPLSIIPLLAAPGARKVGSTTRKGWGGTEIVPRANGITPETIVARNLYASELGEDLAEENPAKGKEDNEDQATEETAGEAEGTETELPNGQTTGEYFDEVKDSLGFEGSYNNIVDFQINGSEGDWAKFVMDPVMLPVYGPEIMGDQWMGDNLTADGFQQWFNYNRENNDIYGMVNDMDAQGIYDQYGTDYDTMNTAMQEFGGDLLNYYGYGDAAPEQADAFYDELIATMMASLINDETGLEYEDLFTDQTLNELMRNNSWTFGEGEGYDTNVNQDFDTYDEVMNTMLMSGDVPQDYPYWIPLEDGSGEVPVPRAYYEQYMQNQGWGQDGYMLPIYGNENFITQQTGRGRKAKEQ